jgi:hypothetical protein
MNASDDVSADPRRRRREFVGRLLQAGGALGGVAWLVPPASRADAPAIAAREVLDLTNSADQVRAWMTLHTRRSTGSVYYWYRCRLDYAVTDQPITPVCGYDSLYRFDVVAPEVPGAAWQVRRWESCIYTDLERFVPIDELRDPLDGRLLRPFHFTEGPMDFRYAATRADGRPFSLPWTVVGDDVWASNDTYWDFPHPLPPDRWPRASSGERLRFSNSSTLRGSMAELEDPQLEFAHCRLSYQATAGWLPWMQRGRSAGHVVWRGQGVKLAALEQVPRDSLRAFEQRHPEMLRATPWAGKRIMFEEYARTRGAERA